jgi:carboxymethylenebutenolidase
MCDQDTFEKDRREYEARGLVTRREFGAGVLGVGVAAMLLPQVVNAQAVTEAEITVRTPDGTADAYFVHPASGTAPAVLVWPDIRGLRPAFRQMGRRLAESGYAVLVVNPFYRSAKASAIAPNSSIDTMRPMAQMLNATTHVTDARALIGWLDAQSVVARNRKIGTTGYCMGGPIVFRTAAAVPDRVGAVGSFHGGGLVTPAPDSPHLQVARSKAAYLVAIAENDDMRAPNDKNVLKETFAQTRIAAEVEVYPAAHGWCPPDSQVYSEPQAEKAWGRLLATFSKALA